MSLEIKNSQLIFSQRKYDFLVFSIVLLLISVVTISAQQKIFAQDSKPILRQFQAPKETHPHDVAVDAAKNGLSGLRLRGPAN